MPSTGSSLLPRTGRGPWRSLSVMRHSVRAAQHRQPLPFPTNAGGHRRKMNSKNIWADTSNATSAMSYAPRALRRTINWRTSPSLFQSTKKLQHCHQNHAPLLLIGSAGHRSGLLHPTRLSRERNVVRNTLADTPSGYIQDPRMHPRTMPEYNAVSKVGAAALEAMEHEKELLDREELAYPGYTTVRIQSCKKVAFEQNSTPDQLQSAAVTLQEELRTLAPLVGQEVSKPLSAERRLLLKWQQRQQRLHDRDLPFEVAPEALPKYRVVLQADGTEKLERPGNDAPFGRPLAATDEAYLRQPVEAEELPAELLEPEKVVVTMADVNHVGYVLGQCLRRLSRYAEAEAIFYDVLRADVMNIDAMEALLELYTGIEGWQPRIRQLMDFLADTYAEAVREGLLPGPSSAPAAPGEPGGESVEEASASKSQTQMTSSASSSPRSTDLSERIPDRSFNKRNATATATPHNGSERDTTAITPANGVLARAAAVYTTVPQVSPVESALSLLADLVMEAAAKTCLDDGEGAASRFFINALGPIVRPLGNAYASALLEALLAAVDEQYFMVQYDSHDVTPAARQFTLSLVIAFLKALTARRMHEILTDPIRSQFATLAKLHAALRHHDRVHESYAICEQLMRLYRVNSSLHRRRMRRVSLPDATARSYGAVTDQGGAHGKLEGENTSQGNLNAVAKDELRRSLPTSLQDTAAETNINIDTTAEASLPREERAEREDEEEEAPGVLDAQDGDYQKAFLQYVNDRARDSPALGRQLCLEAMREFPNAAGPWETMALLLHKENPSANLTDAIVAARHAMALEPLNLSVILTLANFYKAATRYELHDRMLDRYRLLVYMEEEGASIEDRLATAAEVAALDEATPAAQDLVEETTREMREHMFRMEQATTYSMPIDKEPRVFAEAPLLYPQQQSDLRPELVREREAATEAGRAFNLHLPD